MKLIIEFNYWKDERKIRDTDKSWEILHEHALTDIFERIQSGYSSGELNCDINGNTFRGWWELKIK